MEAIKTHFHRFNISLGNTAVIFTCCNHIQVKTIKYKKHLKSKKVKHALERNYTCKIVKQNKKELKIIFGNLIETKKLEQSTAIVFFWLLCTWKQLFYFRNECKHTDTHNFTANWMCKREWVQTMICQGWNQSIHLDYAAKYDSLSHQIHFE